MTKRKKREKRVRENISIRIMPDRHYQAKMAALKSKLTLGEWLEDAIKEKIERDMSNDEKG